VQLQPDIGDFDEPAVAYIMTDVNYVMSASTVIPTDSDPMLIIRKTDVRGESGFANLSAQEVIGAGIASNGAEFTRSDRITIRPNAITMAELRRGIGQWGQ
jgi:hypothetical protein